MTERSDPTLGFAEAGLDVAKVRKVVPEPDLRPGGPGGRGIGDDVIAVLAAELKREWKS